MMQVKYMLFSLLFPAALTAQVKDGYYRGFFKDDAGNIVTQARVQNLRTGYDIRTWRYGYYEIPARVGDTLLFIYRDTALLVIRKGMLAATSITYEAPINQPAQSVYSADYTQLTKDTVQYVLPPAASPWPLLRLKTIPDIYGGVKKVRVKEGVLSIVPARSKVLKYSTSYTAAAVLSRANSEAAVQSDFAQGRSQNGQLTWQGAETGERFSFGPAINNLAWDGSIYAFDNRGKLVAANTEKSNAATANNNSILRNGLLFSQALSLQGEYHVKGKSVLGIGAKMATSDERTIVQQNRNQARSLHLNVNKQLDWLFINTNFSHNRQQYSNGNRNGFLNQVYRQSLLTPASFDNKQGYLLQNGNQRHYANGTDNPELLLSANDNLFIHTQNNATLKLEKNQGRFTANMIQSIEQTRQSSKEGYKPGSAGFASGIQTSRLQQDANYTLHALVAFRPYRNRDYFQPFFALNHISSNTKTHILYTTEGSRYRYQRQVHEPSLQYRLEYNGPAHWSGGVEAENRFYFSNTASRPQWCLPSLRLYVSKNKYQQRQVNASLSVSYNSTASEIPLNRSLAHVNLLQLTTAESDRYFPVKEVLGFKGLLPILHQDWAVRTQLAYNYKLTLSAELFLKQVKNDVYPVLTGTGYQLMNMAAHRNKGIELQLSIHEQPLIEDKLLMWHDLFFSTYRSEVTTVSNGYDFTPLGGFADVHTALVKGQPLGSIVGSRYARTANGDLLIGADGFPLVSSTPGVIGNPQPDFVMKLTNGFRWKKLTLNVDWEWRKGGDIWNGTQAMLDYYGRSQQSADQRGITGYVFNGIRTDGQPNQQPVDFYNPMLPLEQNRWVRYGATGVAEAYIQKGDVLRLNNLSLTYKWMPRKHVQKIIVAAYISNIILWTAYKGADPNQYLFDQPATLGLDFFNLPATKSYGLNLTIQL